MTSTKPYILRAFFQWILDNQLTPYLAVNANFPGTQVPLQHVEEGKITLNINPLAVRDFTIGNEFVSFDTRFSGIIHAIRVPLKAVLAIYARENGRGMVFGEEYDGDSDGDGGNGTPPPPPSGSDKGKPKLTIVK